MTIRQLHASTTPLWLLAFSLAGGLFAPRPAGATTVGPMLELATPAAAQRAPAISYDPVSGVYVMVWEDGRNGANGIDLYVARIGLDGTLQDANGIPVLSGATALENDELGPDIAYSALAGAHVITWHEVRAPAAFTDIWATRFVAPTGTIVPSAGVQLTTGTDSEAFSVVETLGATVLVAWQVNIVGSGQTLRGRRILPDLSLVEPEFDVLAGGTAATPAIAASGSSFFLAWQTNADVFGRLVPDTGTIPAASIVSIATATRAQTLPHLAPLGANGFVAVWEDDRSSTGAVAPDVWGRRFDSMFNPLTPGSAVSEAANDQRRPRVAADVNGGLVVWQDRRNSSATGITYGARLSNTGTLEDPDGFPILAPNGNAFEQAIGKGPADDYLVAAVRFGTPSRIVYRVVRDEPPAGTMSAIGTLMVPADGVSLADVTFGPAQGPSGLPVVADTIYTVSLSNPAVTIQEPDEDPTLPGHQLRSAEGTVTVTLSSLAHVIVDVTVVSVEGTSSGTAEVEFLNVPPEIDNVVVGPPMPRSNEPLSLAYAYSDINSDPESGTTIRWTRNAALQMPYNDSTTVDPSATRRGDLWRATVTPRDGLDFGAPVNSNTVEIGNTPPEASALEVRIENLQTLRRGVAIEAFYAYTDVDLDPEGPSELSWFEDGTERADLAGQDTVPGDQMFKNREWHFTVRPSDNIEFGTVATSPTVTVLNTRPIAVAGPEDGREVLERRSFTLDAGGSSDVDPSDVLTFSWEQQIVGSEPEVTLSDTSSATPSFTAPSVRGTQQLRFNLTVSDGDEPSETDFVIITILPVMDTDGDGLDDEEEEAAGTNPNAADTDRDGLRDPDEVMAGTDPLDEDTDDDGVRDGAEGKTCKNCTDQDPLADPDGDTLVNALDPDSDDDGLFDGTELSVISALEGGGTAPYTYAGTDEAAGVFVVDADPSTGTNPNLADTDEDTFLDGVEDANHDGRVDDGESDPNDAADPGIPCTPGEGSCPGTMVCMGGVCVPGDGTNQCEVPLADTLECCMGGCNAQGTKVAAVCPANATRERCPVGSDQCAANTCVGAPDGPGGEASGCNCSVTASPVDSASVAGLVLLLGALVALRRRR